MNRLRRTFPGAVGLFLVLIGAGCITPFLDRGRYEGARVALATQYNNLMAQREYAQVIALSEEHLDPDDPHYRDAVYFLYQARLAQIQEEATRAEQIRRMKNKGSVSVVDQSATISPGPDELPVHDRSDIQNETGFTEALARIPEGAMKDKLQAKIPVLNVIDTDLDFVIYEIFKVAGIKFIVDPGLLENRKISVRVTDETVIGFLDYLQTTQNIDFSIKNNTLRLHSYNTDLTTRFFRLRHGFQPAVLARDFQSLSDLSFINRANETGGGSGGGGQQQDTQTQGSGGKIEAEGKSFIELILAQLPELVAWPEGSQAFIDKKNNAILVRSIPSTLEEVAKILAFIDIKPIQISIEARFIEVRNMDAFDFGTNLTIGGQEFGSNSGDLGKQTIGEGSGSFFGNPVADAGGGSTGGNLSFSGPLDEGQLSATIFVLDRLETAETLSSPSVTTANNSTATIAVVQNLVFVEEYRVESGTPISGDTGGGGFGNNVFQVPSLVATINDENFTGFVLNVTPSVGGDGEHIALTIQPVVREVVDQVLIESSAVLATGNTTSGEQSFASPDIMRPILETRFVNTNLTVKDGSTIVIGGLTRFVETEVEDKVPFLGDIPILGRLFRRDTTLKDKRNLLIFVTARIINPEGGLYADPVPNSEDSNG